jgi:hypothetical protein
MMAYPTSGKSENLLSDLIVEMKRNVGRKPTYRNIYELPIYNPMKDRTGSPIGRQCLSFMSFKLDEENRLLLSAVFRNHFTRRSCLET